MKISPVPDMATLNGHTPTAGTIGYSEFNGLALNGGKHIKDLFPQTVELPSDPLTPTLDSPEELPTSDSMTGKKIASLERPDDNARHLASILTLEEQVW